MKKTLFLAVMAGAALAGCVKNEPIVSGDGSPGRITFDAPVTNVPTRAEEIYGNYPKEKNFAVYALYHEGEYDANSFTTGTMYMTNVTCTANKTGETETPDYWAPATDYYWPKNGYLTFAAYAPAKNEGSSSEGQLWNGADVGWDETGFTFTNFTVSDTPDNQIDLLYSGRTYDQKKTSMVTDQPYDGVTLLFKHALSSIVFTAKTDADYSGKATIKLTGIQVNNVIRKGTFAQNLTADKAGDSNDPTWTLDAAVAGGVMDYYTAFNLTEGKQLTNTAVYVNDGVGVAANGVRKSDLILIPQSFDRGTGDDGKITVTIKYSIQNANEDPVPQTHTFELAATNPGAGQTNAWEMGKRYTYNIVIGLDQIYFNPTVSNWEDATDTSININ